MPWREVRLLLTLHKPPAAFNPFPHMLKEDISRFLTLKLKKKKKFALVSYVESALVRNVIP